LSNDRELSMKTDEVNIIFVIYIRLYLKGKKIVERENTFVETIDVPFISQSHR